MISQNAKVIAVTLLLTGPLAIAALASGISAPQLISREKWLIPTEPFQTKQMQAHRKGPALESIVIHHTGSLALLWRGKTTIQKMQAYHQIHLKNKQKYRQDLRGQAWGGFAYHYFIDVNGKIVEGRSLEYQGDSGTDYDMSGLILVVLEGNFEGGEVQIPRSRLAEFNGRYKGEPRDVKTDKSRVTIDAIPDQPTLAQENAVDQLIAWLSKLHRIDPLTIKGHKELAVTTYCPGKTLMAHLQIIKKRAIEALAVDKRQ